MEKLLYTLMAVASVLVFGYFCWTGVRVGCDGPPLEEVGLRIGEPCPPETPTPESVIVYWAVRETVYQPVIGLEVAEYFLPIPYALIIIGSVLAIRALWVAKWWRG